MNKNIKYSQNLLFGHDILARFILLFPHTYGSLVKPRLDCGSRWGDFFPSTQRYISFVKHANTPCQNLCSTTKFKQIDKRGLTSLSG